MKNQNHKHIWAKCYTAALALFTAFVLLDTFVIPYSYSAVKTADTAAAETTAAASGASGTSGTTGTSGTDETSASSTLSEETASSTSSSAAKVVTANSYSDGNISITITTTREYDTDIYVADIQVTSLSALKTAFADDTYGRNVTQKTSAIAAAHSAILAINGDFYGARTRGYVIRDGVLYRSNSDPGSTDLCIMSDGTFKIVSEDDYTAQQLLDMGAVDVFNFGPALIDGGTITVSNGDEVDNAMTSNPRTAVGIVSPLHYLFVVSDGRTSESAGLTLAQLAAVMKEYGATTAYNLDGGGSSTMYFNGEVINKPTTNGNTIKQRSVSDIVYIA